MVWNMKKINKKIYHIMTTPPLPTHTQCPKSWGYVDFKMPANENALTQPKFETFPYIGRKLKQFQFVLVLIMKQ